MAKRDEFDDEGFFDSLLNRKGKAELPPGLRRIFIVIGVLVLSVILVSVIVASWPSHHNAGDDAAVPIIHADTEAYKVKPTDAGGMNVPNKDSTIFETLKGKQEADAKPENLLEDDADTKAADAAREQVTAKVEPTKTEPLVDVKLEKTGSPPDEDLKTSPSQPAAAAVSQPAVKPSLPVPVKADTAAVASVLPKEVLPKTPPAKAASAVIADLKQDNVTPAEKSAAAKPKTEAKPTAKPVASGGSAYIQLAAVKSEDEARQQWAKFKSKNPELANLSLKTQKADLGAKGIYYRIQAGPVSGPDAVKTCAAIKARGGSCIIAK